MSCLGTEFDSLEAVPAKDYDGLVVDADGYISTAAIIFSEMFPKAQIVSIEPSTENFKVFSRNIHSYQNISAIRAALVPIATGHVVLSNRGTGQWAVGSGQWAVGSGQWAVGSGQWGYTIIDAPIDYPNSESLEMTPTMTLDDIRTRFDENRIGLLKLDIEGGEKDLFDNGGEALANVNAVFVELHDRIVGGCTDSFLIYSENRSHSNFGGDK